MFLEMLVQPPVSPFRHVKEDQEFYIPDYLGADPHTAGSDLYAAADDHAGELRRAEKHLDEALNLTAVLRASLQEAGDDSRAVQVDTVLKIIEKLLNKAHSCIDRHDTMFMNLFMAYFDPGKGKPVPADD